NNYEPQGKATESEYKTQYNDVFEVDEYYFEKEAHFTHVIHLTNPNTENIQLEISYQACTNVCISFNKFFVFDLKTLTTKEVTNFEAYSKDANNNSTSADDTTKETTVEKTDERGLWKIFILSFLGGFAAILTPCVFPMIPMTVSFFTKQSKSRAKGIKNAIIYGISIIVIYVVLGLLV